MLGVRLSADIERKLDRYARDVGRPKSSVVRDWIEERLNREEIDDLIRNAAKLHAKDSSDESRRNAMEASDAFSRWLDAEDGGYDWGPDGPPAVE